MKHITAWVVLLAMSNTLCLGQARMRKLSTVINHPGLNVYVPYVSLDGSTLIFVSDYGEDYSLVLNYTTKANAVDWKEPMVLPKHVNNRLMYLNGSALGSDGKTLYLSSLKGGGLGGFDILSSEMRGSTWSEPANFGLPVNSPSNEACPSVTSDGNTLFFMRCETMTQTKCEKCKILMSKKSYSGRWSEPVELPEFINTGNSQTPRILGDGETLIFSSNLFPGNKGGMDLYMTRFDGAQWSKPVAMNFANTERDDQFVSATSLGRYLLKDQPGERKNEIVELLFPEEIKPKGVMRVDGRLSGVSNPNACFISIYDLSSQKRIYDGHPNDDGSFTLYFKEGSRYDLAVEPDKDSYSFFSKILDLTSGSLPISQKVDATIKMVAPGDEFELAGISFKEYTDQLTSSSELELRRLTRLINGNPSSHFEINVTLMGYVEDSVQSSPDLTEVNIDSSYVQRLKRVPDSLLSETLEVDSLDLDSLAGQKDTIVTVIVDSLVLKYTYHNDRTEKQAQSILQYLNKQGANTNLITTTFQAIPASIEERKTKVRLRVR